MDATIDIIEAKNREIASLHASLQASNERLEAMNIRLTDALNTAQRMVREKDDLAYELGKFERGERTPQNATTKLIHPAREHG